ncbi:MAG: ABC transporter substrate-binding protein, partial [Chloroflexi bacterium]|nr:ABC transporter substrate-binding protein [Chloroflexota bacterium]
WTVSEDGLTYTFSLRDDVVFSNGDPLSSEDVVFSINRLQNVLGNPSFLADTIAGVEAVDDLTVAFTLTEPRPDFLANLANTAFSISNAEVVRANGGTDAEDAAQTDTADGFLNSNSAGTGPYILESWTQQDETVLVRNENYWGDAPYFDRVIMVNIPEAATQQIALRSGDIDIALDLTAEQIAAFEADEAFSVFQGPGKDTHFLLMNQDPEIGGPMSNPLVQLAVRYALDYEGYLELWGGVTPGTNLTVGLVGAYGQDQAFTRDLDRARELMEEAGYPDGFDITLSYPDFTNEGVDMNINAQKIQADLAEIGINVSLQPGEVQVALETYRSGLDTFSYWFWGPDILDPLDVLSFLPEGKVGGERANWFDEDADPEIIELRELATVESDLETRLELFAQIQDYLQQNGPWAPFILPPTKKAFGADIQGFLWHPQWQLDVALLSRAE